MIILGAMAWLCYIENLNIVRRVIMKLNWNRNKIKVVKFFSGVKYRTRVIYVDEASSS